MLSLQDTTTIVASYERVSTRMQGRYGFSLGAQHQSLEDYITAQGWLLPEHLRFRDGEDEDASGADWDLPGLTGMLEAARRKDFQTLVVPDLDRFARSLVKGLVLEEQLKNHGVKVIYQRVPVEESPEGRLLKHQLFTFAEFEREKITLRTMMGRRRKAQLGQVVGVGGPPYGYRFTYSAMHHEQRVTGLEPNPLTAPIAQRILRDLRTHSTNELAAALNSEGVRTTTGRRWTSKLIHRIATNPVYVGTWVYGRHGRRVTPEDHGGIAVAVPALITRHEWDEIQRALAHRHTARRGQVPREQDPFLLRGALTCGHCHGALSVTFNRGTRYYRCLCHYPARAARAGKSLCSLPDAHAVDLETELWSILSATLLDAEYLAAGLDAARAQHGQADQLRQERLAALDAEIARQRQRLDALAARLADAGNGEVFAALMRQAKDIEPLIDRLTQEKAELAAVRSDGLSDEDALEIEAFADQIRTGLSLATPAERRQLYELLQVRGKVYEDPEGIRLGRKHAYRIEWQAPIQLRHNSSRFK